MKKYQIIYADPPWSFDGGIRSSKKIEGKYQRYTPDTTVGLGRYDTMLDNDIVNLPKIRQKTEAIRDKRFHSRKPDIIRDKIVELMGDLPRIELFSRQKAEGWDCWGNEVESDIELTN